MNTYIKCAAGYGFCRSMCILHNTQIKVQNQKTQSYETRPLMITEKLFGVAYGTVMGMTFAPLLVCKDVHNLELILRGRYYVECGQKEHYSSIGAVLASIVE